MTIDKNRMFGYTEKFMWVALPHPSSFGSFPSGIIAMQKDRNTRLAELEAAIGHSFNNRALLVEALTHKSLVNEAGGKEARDNQRLEFLGDAVLSLLVSSRLIERFPASREGELTKKRAVLVDEESLAGIALKIGLGNYLFLGRGEERSGGREKKSILADAFEALLAAVYLDGGVVAADRLVAHFFGALLEQSVASAASRDYKTEFQERAQALQGVPPHYLLTKSSGPDHDRRFTVAAFVGDRCLGEGAGRSKKEAEQAAAREALTRLNLDAAPAKQ